MRLTRNSTKRGSAFAQATHLTTQTPAVAPEATTGWKQRDNGSIASEVQSAAKKLGYATSMFKTSETSDGIGEFAVFCTKSSETGTLAINFDVPAFGNVTGTVTKFPTDMDADAASKALRDIMIHATSSGEVAALPYDRSVNLNMMLSMDRGHGAEKHAK